MLTLHPESHVDHVPKEIVEHVLARFPDASAFGIETFDLPEGLTIPCALYGPCCGDSPVPESEVCYVARQGRAYPSRMIDRPTRQTRVCTVIFGPSAKDAAD